MSRLLHVVGAQISPVGGDPEATFAKFEDEVRTIRESFPKAQLYLFPELYLAGEQPFRTRRARSRGTATACPVRSPSVSGPWRAAPSGGSKPDRSTRPRGGARTTPPCCSPPTARSSRRYRKLFPWLPFEGTDPGSTPAPVVELPRIGKAGMMICYDGWFPEVPRSLALLGADVILHPTLTSTPDREEELVLARANAIVNQCYVLNVNGSLEVGGGRSIGVDPEGRVLFEGGNGEELLSEVLDLDRVRTVRERGTRGMNRLLFQLGEHGPKAAEPDYRGSRRRRTR